MRILGTDKMGMTAAMLYNQVTNMGADILRYTANPDQPPCPVCDKFYLTSTLYSLNKTIKLIRDN